MGFFSGFSDELLKLANGDMLAYYRDNPKKLKEKQERDKRKKELKEEKKKKKNFIRKAGPGLGALTGLGIAAATKRPILTGVGAGATIGWIPDITASLVEAIKDKKKEIENKKTP